MDTVGEQIRGLLISVGAGGLVGLVYDFFWLGRHRLHLRKVGTGVGDLLFWLLCTGLAFFLLLVATNGEMRLYVLLGILGGLGLYFTWLSPRLRQVLEGITTWLLRCGQVVIRVTLWPFGVVGRVMLVPLGVIGMGAARVRSLFHRPRIPPE